MIYHEFSVIRQILFFVFLIIGFSGFAFSQSNESESEQIEISVCRPSMTEAGRQSSFRFSYVYLVVTDEKGLVKEVREALDHKKFRHLMNDENVIPCIKKWKLKSSRTYIVTISVGTSGDQFLSISGKKDKIKINL
jgi:hypothetical protein